MKIYLLQHTFNKAHELCSYYATECVFSSEEKAIEHLESIKHDIESGISQYFPHQVLKAEKIPWRTNGYTFPWVSNGGVDLFTHFYIEEKEVL